ncbi:hypothetical protein TrRE_jg9523 [Triparma retinervis]|uniref:SSD domain-containing protein n=1 Tax=Triparma retinervis TaxID=2557542 RepID=A0A9W7DRM3_9STRA|nr:hypothetical protein TrRE_jg9523 [Triparma retinervis]
MMFRPETASSSNFLEDDSKHLRLSIEIQLNLVDHFGFGKVCWTNESQPRISGVGSCWGWDLARFDEDEDRIGTLSECIKFDKYIESMYMAGVEKDRNSGRLTKLTGVFTSYEMLISQPEIKAIDDFIMTHQTDEVHLGTIGWTGINNAIYSALIHDMPFMLGPVIILTVYVSHIFYRKGNDSHMSLAFTGIANVFMAVISGIGLTLSWGTGFTALHVCAVYITLGIGIDDAFIITAAVYGTQKQLGKFGNEEIRRRVRIGMSKCGPSILLTSLTDFFAFFSNVSSNVFAIRNFSMVAAIMVLIDFIFQVTFFISTLVLDMQRQEANRYDILCCFKRGNAPRGGATVVDDGFNVALQNRKLSDYEYPANFERSKSSDSDVSALSAGSLGESGTLFPGDFQGSRQKLSPANTSASSSDRGEEDEAGRISPIIPVSPGRDLAPRPPKKEEYSKRIMNAVLYPVILNGWGKIGVLTATATAIMIGFVGCSQLSITYSPFLLIPAGNIMHTNRQIMHDHFPWIMEESWTCVLTKAEVDYSLHQQDLLDLEEFVCDNAVSDKCFTWYGIFRVYVSAKYMSDPDRLEAMLDEDRMFLRDDFYRELKEFSEDLSMGGQGISNELIRWKSETEIIGSRMCFMWGNGLLGGVPHEIDWMNRKRKEVKEISSGLDVSVFTRYFYSIEALSSIVPDTLRNFSVISVVVLMVCLIVLANIKATLLVLTSVVTIEIIVLGSLHFFGMHFNMMTSIMLIVGVGLCVDFSAHSAHAFLHSRKDAPHDKVRDALDTVGVSIWNGAFSSILAMLPMCLCQSYFVTTWWRVISLVIALGIFYGLCVVPVLLTLFDDDDDDGGTSDWTIVSPEGKKMGGASFADFEAEGEGEGEGEGGEGEGVELSLFRRKEGRGGGGGASAKI